jgi:hypothetical protein
MDIGLKITLSGLIPFLFGFTLTAMGLVGEPDKFDPYFKKIGAYICMSGFITVIAGIIIWIW